jgi:tetratricopeptide (TPR) repeat protein
MYLLLSMNQFALPFLIAALGTVDLSNTQLVRSQESLQVAPNNSDTLLSAAKDQYGKGNHKQAIDLASQAIKANANNVNAFYYRGISRLALQRKSFQIKSLRLIHQDLSRVIELDPSNRDAHYYYGLASYKIFLSYTGSSFISVGYSEPDLHRTKWYRDQSGDYWNNFQSDVTSQANDSFKKYVEDNPTALNESYLHYADSQIIHIGYGSIENIKLTLDKISNKDTNPDVYFLRGMAYYNKYVHSDNNEIREIQEGLENFNKSIELRPNNPDAYFFRAKTYVKLKNIQSAIEDYTQVIKLLPQEAAAYRERAKIYQSIGDSESAAKDERKADMLK